mmetsp:Transcript_35609/g.33765  ORF Transcript_35609/g.33765 Transcript_35609/m.33765 type:complete len:126 (+) Transcript_35609:42-419(+)
MFARSLLSNVGRAATKISFREFSRGTGKVKFFDVTKGFGFIAPNDGSPDCFVHQTAIVSDGFRSLAEGEDVEYDVVSDPNKGGKLSASNVTGPDGSPVVGAPQRDDRGGGGGRGGNGRRDDNDRY